MLGWLVLIALAEPIVARDVSVYRRSLGEDGPHHVVDDDSRTVWRGRQRARASFWFQQHTRGTMAITGCGERGTVRLRAYLTTAGDMRDEPWTEVALEPNVARSVTLATPAIIDMIQIELVTATCVAQLEVDTVPQTPKRNAASSNDVRFCAPSRNASIGRISDGQPECTWFERSGSEVSFQGTCDLHDDLWSLRGRRLQRREDGVPCWTTGMPYDFPGPACPWEVFRAKWPVTRLNKCLVLVEGRTYGRCNCW